jgi:hypothetical protein
MPIMIDMPDRFCGRPASRRDPGHPQRQGPLQRPDCRALAPVTRAYHSTAYVASLIQMEGWPAYGHAIGGQSRSARSASS